MADVAINSDSATIPSVNFTEQGSDPAAPAASHWQLFFKSGGLYARKSDGTVLGPFGEGSGGDITVREVDGDPIITGAALVVPNGTLSQDGSGRPQLAPLGVNVQESVDKTPMHALLLEFPDGSLTDQGAGVIGYTPTGSGGVLQPTLFWPLSNLFTNVSGTWGNTNNTAYPPYNRVTTNPGQDGNAVSFPFYLPAGTYTFTFISARANTGAIVDIAIGDVSIGSYDCYNSGTQYSTTQAYTGIVVPSGGKSTLTFTVNGRNASSGGWTVWLVAMMVNQTA